jgi:hypothetical protein
VGTSVLEIVNRFVSVRRTPSTVTSQADRLLSARESRRLRGELGVGVPMREAAAALGVSVQRLDRWVAAERVPVVRRPGSSRYLVRTNALLALAEEVTRLREEGVSGTLEKAIDALEAKGELRRTLRPNPSAQELRYEFVHSTGESRFRAAVELSHFAAALAAKGRASRQGGTVSPPNAQTQPRFYDLLRVLCEHEVTFIVIGGLALGLHGFVRATKDVDIAPEPGVDNSSRLRDALVVLEGPINPWPYVEDRDGELPFEDLRQEAVRLDVEEIGHPIWVASVEHLIGMKEHAGRDQDRVDITGVRLAQGLEDA